MRLWPVDSARAATWLALIALGGCGGASNSTLETHGASDGANDAGGSGAGSSTGGNGGSGGDGSGGGGSSDPTPGSDAGSGGSKGTGGASDASAGGGAPTDAGHGDAATSAGDDAGSLAAARVQCVQIINQYRATLSPPAPALVEDTAEESCVDTQAQKDYAANTAHSAFGECKEFAQDECPGWPGPPSAINTGCLKSMWDEGPPPAGEDNHWLNMSNASYTKVACGFYQTPKGDWWTDQDFW